MNLIRLPYLFKFGMFIILSHKKNVADIRYIIRVCL